LGAYQDELVANNSNPYNAQQPKAHLPANMLSMPLALIKADELRRWRNGLTKRGMTADNFNRTRSNLLAMVPWSTWWRPIVHLSGRRAWKSSRLHRKLATSFCPTIICWHLL
jgi:hypothetical protein